MACRQRTILTRVGLLAWLALSGCAPRAHSGPSRARPPPLAVTATVQTREVRDEASGPVELRPVEQVDLGAKVIGILDAVQVERGDRVTRGQVLFVVRPSDLPAQQTALRATLDQARASLRLTRQQRERARDLGTGGFLPAQDLERSEAAVVQAEAAEATLRAQLAALATRLDETRIEAPFDGVVLQRRLDPGALVGAAGSTVLTVARIDVLRATIGVGEQHVPRLREGQTARLAFDGVDAPLEATVVRLAPALDPATRLLDAEVRLDNREGRLRPGLYGRAAIELARRPAAVVVPIEAVQWSDGRAHVFVVHALAVPAAAGQAESTATGNGRTRASPPPPDAKVERRALHIGVDGGTWLEVTAGLEAGERIVVAGLDALSDGASVRTSAGPPTQAKRAAARPALPTASGKGR